MGDIILGIGDIIFLSGLSLAFLYVAIIQFKIKDDDEIDRILSTFLCLLCMPLSIGFLTMAVSVFLELIKLF